MRLATHLASALALLLLVAPAVAEEAQPGDTIQWHTKLPAAFAKAKADQKVLMICVNAKQVDGTRREEPAAKGLREVIYKDVRVVSKSRAFVCAFLTPGGSSDDYGELRALGIDGLLVSPQHIFVHPDGKLILVRKQYWSHGQGESGVKALLGFMQSAQDKLLGGGQDPAPPGEQPADPAAPAEPAAPDAEPAPKDDGAAERAAWILRMLKQVVEDTPEKREAAIKALVVHDKDGDGVNPLIALFPEHKKNIPLLVSLVRGLGRNGVALAALPIAGFLKHKEEELRGNAAVSLEYIGANDKKVLAALKKAVGKEKNEEIANHMYRALGRCGAKDAKTRALLLKKSGSAKSEFGSYGPVIGLAYFEDDKKAMRGVEKILQRMGVPGSRRGGGTNVVKRGVVSWTLAAIGDAKSGTFVREELIGRLENVKAFWVGGLIGFWELVAECCEGEERELGPVEGGVRGFVTFAKRGALGRFGAEMRNLMDAYRNGRDTEDFQPKGDNLLNDERGM